MKALVFDKFLKLPPYGGYLINILRLTIFLIIILASRYVSELEISVVASAIFAGLGIWLGSELKRTRLRFLGLLLILVLIYLTVEVFFRTTYFVFADSNILFFLYNIHAGLSLYLTWFLVATLSTWLFWTFPAHKVVELILLGLGILALFSAHRNYRFDSSRLLNELSWKLQLYPLVTLIGLGLIFSLFSIAYLHFSTRASKLIPITDDLPVSEVSSPRSVIKNTIGISLLTFGFIYIAWNIYLQQKTIIETRQQNGVSSETKEGLSPLTFQSALGASSQPAGIVRLESDYLDNPYSPMLYLREAALSEYNGHEIVIAPDKYDKDAPLVLPGSNFKFDVDTDLELRTPITQSIYLLAEHKRAFGVDYPISMVALTLPKGTNKFRKAFRVYSMAPALKKSELNTSKVGDPRWDKETWDHYTKINPDPRYGELAQNIAKDLKEPLQKANAIIEYLNKNAIYTLKPGHNVPKEEDQVVPFLFGDMRGYCVHFAHATVYLLRALNIPARIGTGYLTDLSQSKDGHILLRMSDRHAWAEIYLAGRGWMPYDVEPEQVEVHAETPVDQSLLEELMGLLGPSEEIVPKDVEFSEPALKPTNWLEYLELRHLYILLISLVILLYLYKFYKLKAVWLPGSPNAVARRAINALYLKLADLGKYREKGETLQDFLTRLGNNNLVSSSNINDYYLANKYSVLNEDARSIRREYSKTLRAPKQKSFIIRFIRFFNPITVFKR